MGLPERSVDVYDPVQQLAIVHDDVLERFGVDTVEMGRGFCLEDKWWTEWVLPDGTPCRMPVWALPERAGTEWVMRVERPSRATDSVKPQTSALRFVSHPHPPTTISKEPSTVQST